MSSTTNVTSMTRFQIGWAFRVAKEFHVITLQAFVNVCSPPNSIVVDLNYETCACIHPSLIVLDFKLFQQYFLFLTSLFDYFYKE